MPQNKVDILHVMHKAQGGNNWSEQTQKVTKFTITVEYVQLTCCEVISDN